MLYKTASRGLQATNAQRWWQRITLPCPAMSKTTDNCLPQKHFNSTEMLSKLLKGCGCVAAWSWSPPHFMGSFSTGNCFSELLAFVSVEHSHWNLGLKLLPFCQADLCARVGSLVEVVVLKNQPFKLLLPSELFKHQISNSSTEYRWNFIPIYTGAIPLVA